MKNKLKKTCGIWSSVVLTYVHGDQVCFFSVLIFQLDAPVYMWLSKVVYRFQIKVLFRTFMRCVESYFGYLHENLLDNLHWLHQTIIARSQYTTYETIRNVCAFLLQTFWFCKPLSINELPATFTSRRKSCLFSILEIS